jgi:protease PrsW
VVIAQVGEAALTAPFFFFLHLAQVAVFVVALRYLDLYEREPLTGILAMFAWGGLGATMLSLLGNGIVNALLPVEVAVIWGPAISAPVVEELAKGLALLGAFVAAHFWSKRFGTLEFAGVVDGIVYGAAVGFGFAFTENLFFFVQQAAQGGLDLGLEVFLLRVDFLGLQSTTLLHGLASAFFGAGLGLATWHRNASARIGYPLLGLAGAWLVHATWNGLGTALTVRQFGFDTLVAVVTGTASPQVGNEVAAAFERNFLISQQVFYLYLAVGIALFVFWLRHERQVIRFELEEELRTGLITREEWELLPNARQRFRWYWGLLRAGRGAQFKAVRDLHDRLVDLAFAKWCFRRYGGDADVVHRMRREVGAMRVYVTALADIGQPEPPPHAAPTAGPPAGVGGTPPPHGQPVAPPATPPLPPVAPHLPPVHPPPGPPVGGPR